MKWCSIFTCSCLFHSAVTKGHITSLICRLSWQAERHSAVVLPNHINGRPYNCSCREPGRTQKVSSIKDTAEQQQCQRRHKLYTMKMCRHGLREESTR